MKKASLICSLILLLMSLLSFSPAGIVLAQDEAQPVATANITNITLRANYPKVEAIAGSTFEFPVVMTFKGEDTRIFDLRTTAPSGWDVYVTPQYEKDKKISSISMKPNYGSTEATINVFAVAPFWPLPDPGDYEITLDVVSDTVKSSVELTAKVTAKYILNAVPANEQYNTTAKSGQDSFFSIKVQNMGTAAVDNIKFSSTKPDGWTVEFKPEKIDALEAFDEQTVDVNIKPPAKTVAGDYMVTLRASGTQTSTGEMNIRVTVETPTVWGWVGVAIIVIVVIGLVFIFMRFSRR